MMRLLGGLLLGTFALVAGCGDFGSPIGGGGGGVDGGSADLRISDMQATADLRPPAGFDMSSATILGVPRNCNTQTIVSGTQAYRTLTNNNTRCVNSGCHNTLLPKFTNQQMFMAATVNVKSTSDYPYIAPFNPDRSFLLYKLRGTQAMVRNGGGTLMPRNSAALTDAEQCQLYNWVLRGAPVN